MNKFEIATLVVTGLSLVLVVVSAVSEYWVEDGLFLVSSSICYLELRWFHIFVLIGLGIVNLHWYRKCTPAMVTFIEIIFSRLPRM